MNQLNKIYLQISRKDFSTMLRPHDFWTILTQRMLLAINIGREELILHLGRTYFFTKNYISLLQGILFLAYFISTLMDLLVKRSLDG